MADILSLVTIIGPVLLLAAIIYAWMRNRNAPKSNLREAERGAARLQDELAHEPENRH